MNTVPYYGHTLTWEEHSPGQHTLIFLNGYSASRRSWSQMLPHFAPLGRCVTLIGHSTGGLAALGIAARLPQRVKRVISIDGVVWGPLTGLLGFAHLRQYRPCSTTRTS